LARGGEQQRRYRLAAAHPTLRDVLLADAKRQLGQLLFADIRRSVAQHVGHDLVSLEEHPQHRVRHQRPLRVQHRVDLGGAPGDVRFPILMPRHLVGDVSPE
jgi:hypothetical protein